MSDSAIEITNLIYRYAELLDGGDLDAVADLFAHGRICGVENGPPETVFTGTAGVRKMYEMATRIYDDGTPKTKHNTSNVQLEIDEAGG
ncbi:MAG: nuclear transport factor 2 family protein, partial [Mycobacterium sp.]|uniref:nuclear transport factor 2 family protein n=1 Tax=Mycobacterium sp. TaxID=1785 RepID=UPI003BAE5F35